MSAIGWHYKARALADYAKTHRSLLNEAQAELIADLVATPREPYCSDKGWIETKLVEAKRREVTVARV